MNDNQIAEFNSYYQKATDGLNKIILLGDYRPNSIGFFGKLKAKKAIQNFEKCLSIYPEHWQSLFFLGKIYQRLKDHQKALDYMEVAAGIETNNPNIPQEAAIEAMHLDQVEKAIMFSAESVRRSPEGYAQIGNYAMNLLIGKRDNEALEMINKAITINPNDGINNNIKKIIQEVINGSRTRPTFKEMTGG